MKNNNVEILHDTQTDTGDNEPTLNRPKWTGFFKVVQPQDATILQTDNQSVDGSLYSNVSWYQFITYGSAARLNRYREYDMMDTDVDIAKALDVTAEEICGNRDKKETPLVLNMVNDSQMPKNSAYAIALNAALRKWCKIQKLDQRLFPTARKAVKYGDCLYLKTDNVTQWKPLSPKQIIGAIVDKDDVTRVLGYQIRLDVMHAQGSESIGGYQTVGNETNLQDTQTFPTNQVIRFSVNTELADTAPFGESILQSVYRTFRQKQLLEDAIVIYRISRAPERRAFYIDTSGMSPNRIQQYLEAVKNDINQKRIPSTNAGGGIESTYNPACLSLDTKIPLLDGRTLSLCDIINEYNNGKELWTYSVNPGTGQTVPGKITWAGVTRKDAKTITLLFDNNKTLVCTPDHKIPVQGKGFVEAGKLTSGDSLFPYNVKYKPLCNNKHRQYVAVYDTLSGEWIHVHRMVAEYMKSKNKDTTFVYEHATEFNTVHHVDYNKDNNTPENLVWMDSRDHIAYHGNNCNKDMQRMRNQKRWKNLLDNHPETAKQHILKMHEAKRQGFINNPQKCLQWKNRIAENKALHPTTNATVVFSFELMQEIRNILSQNIDIKYFDFIDLINSTHSFTQLYRDLQNSNNPFDVNKVNPNTMSETAFKRCLREYGYTFKTLKQNIIMEKIKCYEFDENTKFVIDVVGKYGIKLGNIIKSMTLEDIQAFLKLDSNRNVQNFNYWAFDRFVKNTMNSQNLEAFLYKIYKSNHRVVSIFENEDVMDVGTITIDGNHELHDYHTFAIDAGIYVKNSQMDDYYFAVRENGNGSRVEVLPGGQSVGVIEDLEFFEDKLFRGLRIPLSYIKSQADNPSIFNDGKIGTAYIEELRFAQYIERLQQNFEEVLDAEFKEFVREVGLAIDPNSYYITLPPPSNFGVYREMEMNAELLNVFATADGVNSISKRFAMHKYLKWTETDIATNEHWKRQELGIKQNDPTAFRKIYDSNYEEGEAGGLGGGSMRDLDSAFGGGGMSDLGAEEDMGAEGLDNVNDEGNLNAGGGDELGSSGAEPPPTK